MRRALLALLLGAGVVAGFGSGFASMHARGGGWGHCPHAADVSPTP